MNFKSLPHLITYFNTEQKAIDYLENSRWNGNIVCPHCGHGKTYKTNIGYKCADSKCYKKFTVKVGTIFEDSKISLKTWFAAIYLITSQPKGISSIQLHKHLGVTQKTAWFMLHRIREMLKNNTVGKLSGTVEADETYLGGQDKNRHKHKQKGDANYWGKTIVIGALERGGNVVLKQVPTPDKKSIKPFIKNNVKKDSVMMTDEHKSYLHLKKNYTHQTVNHSLKVYVDGDTHTNGMENFWSLLKRGVYGTYHYISPKHTQRYLSEFSGRFNTRTVNDSDRFNMYLGKSEGRLTYKLLINKKNELHPNRVK